MKYDQIKEILAPCGLNCTKCVAYSQGEIKQHSEELLRLLGEFDRYAERFSFFLPVFENYPAFKELLVHFSQAECGGCRSGERRYPNCGVAYCIIKKGVDFCAQCGEFPCAKTNFDPNLKEKWLKMNTRIKEIGLEAYFEETKNQPRYI